MGQRHSHSGEPFDKIYPSSKGVTWEALPPWWVGTTILGPRGCWPRAGTLALSTAGLVLPQAAAARAHTFFTAEPLLTPQLLSVFLQGASRVGNQTQRLLNPFNHALSTSQEGQDGGGRNADEGAIFEWLEIKAKHRCVLHPWKCFQIHKNSL